MVSTRGTGRHGPGPLDLGTVVPPPAAAPVRSLSADLDPHLGTPWLERWLARRLGAPLASGPPRPGKPTAPQRFAVDPAANGAGHILDVGASGGGKTMLALAVGLGWLAQGGSLLVLESKLESVVHWLAIARAAGLPPGAVSLLCPQLSAYIGCNPFAAGLPAGQAAADFAAGLRSLFPSWGPRLEQLLVAAATVAAAHRLSPLEAHRLLVHPPYRAALLGRRPPDADGAYAEAHAFFAREFAAWGKSAQVESVSHVSNKLSEMWRLPDLAATLAAKGPGPDLAAAFAAPRVTLVHLDRLRLGDAGARLLGGLLAAFLFRTAVRTGTGAPVAVALVLDELSTLQRFVPPGLLAEALSVGRSYGLRLVGCAQYLAQLDPDLRESFLANAGLLACFRPSPGDAVLLAAAFPKGAGGTVSVALDRAARPGAPGSLARERVLVTDAAGRPLALSPKAWAALQAGGTSGPAAAERLAAWAARTGRGPLFLRGPAGAPLALAAALKKLAPADWAVCCPAPLAVSVRFPRPKVAAAVWETAAAQERAYAALLRALPRQHALCAAAGQAPILVRVRDVPPAPAADDPELRKYVDAAVRANGIPAAAALSAKRERDAAVEALAAGRAPIGDGATEPPAPGEEDDDGSLA